MARPRDRILANLERLYRDAYDRAKATGDERRMVDLDATYQRDQLLLEVLLDIRDALVARPASKAEAGADPVAALETIRRLSRLR